MQENAAVILQVCACNGLASRTFGIERGSPQHDVLAIKRAVALTNRHRRLARVEPDCRKAIRLWIESGDSRARALRSIRIEEREIGLEKFSVLDHVLLARAFRHSGFAACWKESLNDLPIAYELREQLLTGSGSIRRLILVVGLLSDCR